MIMPNGPAVRVYDQQYTANPGGTTPRADPSTWAAGVSSDAPGLAALAQGLDRVSDAAKRAEEADARAWSSKALSKARLDWTEKFLEHQQNASEGAHGFTPKVLGEFDEYAGQLIETAPTSTAKRFLSERMSDFRASLGESSLQFEAKARIDWRSDQFGQGIENSKKLMNTDPGQYNVALAEQVAVIDAAMLPPVQKSALRDRAVQEISQAAVWAQVQKSPMAFFDSIGFGPTVDGKTRKTSGNLTGVTGNAAFDALNFDKRVQMFEGAVRMKAQLDSDADKAAEKAMKKQSDEAMKEGWGRLASGTLTRKFVEEIRPLLSPAEYHSLLSGMKEGGKGSKTDPSTFNQLQGLIYSDPAAAQKFAFQAHKAGLLSNEHLSSALSKSREIDRSEGPKSEYERSRKYIVGSLDPGAMVPDPVSRGRLAEAVDAFDRWATSSEKPRTDEEIYKRSREIVDQYRFIDLSQTVLALPQPRGTSIRRNASDLAGTQNDILAAKNKLDKDLSDGKLTPEEHRAEMNTLNRWRKAIERK